MAQHCDLTWNNHLQPTRNCIGKHEQLQNKSMGSVGVRNFISLSIDVDPSKRINIQKADCNECVNLLTKAVKKNPWNQEDENAYEKPIVILLHYHPQLNIVFDPATEGETGCLDADIDKKCAGEWPLHIVNFWKSRLKQLHFILLIM